MTELEQMGKRAKEAARELAFAGDKKNQGLAAIAKALREHKDNIRPMLWILKQPNKTGCLSHCWIALH